MIVGIISWLLAIPLLGFTTGLRTFTPMALLCWFAYAGQISVDGTWASWTARLWVAIAFTVLALGELVGDKLPKTPNRTSPGPLIARMVMGGLGGAICAAAMEGPELEGILLGASCALLGAFAGFMIRRDLVQSHACADWPIAVGEDLITILCAIFSLHVVAG
jgi:uncharacterized membrane protein